MEEIKIIAKSFINKLNQEKSLHPDYEYGFDDNFVEYIGYWYFDFKILPKKVIKEDEIESFIGARGFIISKLNKEVNAISWPAWSEMNKKESRRKELDKLLFKLDDGKWNLAEIRKITRIKPNQILDLRKKYQTLDLTLEKNRLKVILEIEKHID